MVLIVKYSFVLAAFLVLQGLASGQICSPNGSLRPATQIQGTLDASSCLLADGTPYSDYRITFPRSGLWTASVTAGDGVTPFSIALRDSAGVSIASGSSISRNVERGEYHVIVNVAAQGQGGAFTLSSAFTAAANVLCQQFPMLGSGSQTAPRQTQGALGQGSCTLPDGSVFDGYQITLYGTGTIDVAITAQFTPLLILRSADGHALGTALTPDATGAVHLTLPEIGSDTYTLIVAVSTPDQAGGSYSLAVAFTPDDTETCVSTAALTATQQLNGLIANGSCNFNLPGRDDSSPFNFYSVHLDSAGAVQISVDSADFSSLLLLLDADGNEIAEDIQSSSSGTPLIRQQLPAGDYRLAIFNEDVFGGNYRLNYQYVAGTPPVCAIPALAAGQPAAGTLSGASSCKDRAFLADGYQVVLPADGTLALTLASPDFTTYLDLHDAKDNVLTWGTHSQDESTSVLTADLAAGTYYIYAATADMPGGYTVSYTFTPKTLPACPAPVAMPPNGYSHNNRLGLTGCQGPDGRTADWYQFTLQAPATEAIFQTSLHILPDLTLYDVNGVALRSDQNSYAGNNAVIVQYLPAGTYQIRARSADPTLSGLYNLDLFFVPGAPPTQCGAQSLPLSGTTQGQTSIASCTWYDKTFANIYSVNIPSGGLMLDVTCNSGAFDAFLVLQDAKGNVLASDDNGGGGTDATLIQILDEGTYYLVVKPSNDPSQAGPYAVSSSTEPIPSSSER